MDTKLEALKKLKKLISIEIIVIKKKDKNRRRRQNKKERLRTIDPCSYPQPNL